MMKHATRRRELPPTAGLPLYYRDCWPAKKVNLAQGLADWLSIPLPTLTCSGTAAFIIALRTLLSMISGRNKVIVPAYTCPLVALAAFYCPRLQIVPCDLKPNSLDFDENMLEELCDESTLAVVVTHLAGRVADVDSAKHYADAVGAKVIEDAAQSMGATHAGHSVGLTGDIGFFSMALGKGLTTAEGGVLFSRDPTLHLAMAKRSRKDLPLNLLWETRRTLELLSYAWFYHPKHLYSVYGKPLSKALAKGDKIGAVGDNFTIHDIPLHSLGNYRQRVGAMSLKRLPAYQQQVRLTSLQRVEMLNTIPGVQVLTDNHENDQGVWPFLMVIMPTEQARDVVLEQLWTAGLGVTRLFIHTLAEYSAIGQISILETQTPNAIDFAHRTFSITTSHWLSDDEFKAIYKVVRQAASRTPATT